MIDGYHEREVDFAADNPALTLFHYHQQPYRFRLYGVFDYAA
jgi:hypothetical protein